MIYKLSYFVPTDAKELTKESLFEVGAGCFENYVKCSWEAKGVGQFMPVNSAKPAIGSLGTLERVEEYKVEMICSDRVIDEAIRALKDSHPYEEVAYEVIRLEEF